MRNYDLVVTPAAWRSGVGLLLDLCAMANRYSATLYGAGEPTPAIGPKVLSLDGRPVAAADGRPIAVDAAVASEPVYDGVFVAGFDAEAAALRSRLDAPAPLSAWLADQHR